MSCPRIMYHLTEGNKTDYGWGWRRVESQFEIEQLIKSGWVNSVEELNKTADFENKENTEDIQEEQEQIINDVIEEQVSGENEETLPKKRGRKPKKAA